jgi:hypothetical protein
MEAKQSNADKLIVRVKRKRCDEASDTICIQANRNLVLKRIRTVGYTDRVDLDDTTRTLQKYQQEDAAPKAVEAVGKKRSTETRTMLVAKGRRTISSRFPGSEGA